MRIRTIKPEWLTDAKLQRCDDAARLLSVALWTVADDGGRGQLGWELGARVWSRDPSRLEHAFQQLQGWYVDAYEVRGEWYFQIINWSKHQMLDSRRVREIYPKPVDGKTLEIPWSLDMCDACAPHVRRNGDACAPRDLDLDLDQDLKVPEGTLSTSPTPTVPTYRISDDLELSEPDVIRGLFDYWIRTLGKDPKRVKLTKKRREHIRARLREGYTPADIFDAIRGVASSPFHMGKNDRKTEYNDLTFVCRNGENVERFRDMVTDPNRRRDDRVDWNYIATDQFA